MADLALAYDSDSFDPLAGSDHEPDDRVMRLEEIANSDINLADHISEHQRNAIVTRCLEGFQRDLDSRQDWENDFDNAMRLVRQESVEGGLWFDRASDVRYPLLTVAAIQFGTRAYGAIVNGSAIAKARVTGADPDGAKAAHAARISEHMSYQLTDDMPEWETETDSLLQHLPIAGMAFRQWTWDEENNRPKSEFISAKRIVVNQSVQALETAPLFTKTFERYPYEIIEKQRSDRYREVDLTFDDIEHQKPEDMLECHVRYDLDDDAYDEPYIAIIHKESQQLLSLRPEFWEEDVRRGQDGRVQSVSRRMTLVTFRFMPDPEGAFMGMGFGRLLRSHNEIINSIINQLVDAATLQNMSGGFIGSGARLRGGRLEFEPGEWKSIDTPGQQLAQNIVPFPKPQPSAVLMQLLSMIVESGKDITAVQDVLTGDAPKNQPATTTLAMIEQGMQVFNAIYKRIYRAMTAEFQMQYDLNGMYLPEDAYEAALGDPRALVKQDYALKNVSVRPVADPTVTTAPQRMAQAEFIKQVCTGNPMFDQHEVAKRILEAGRIPDTEALFAKQQGPSPQEQMQMEAAATKLAGAHVDIQKTQVDIDLKRANAAKLLAEAQTEALAVEQAHRGLMEQDTGAQAGSAAAQNVIAFEQAFGNVGGVGGMVGPSPNPAAPAGAGAGAAPTPGPGAIPGVAVPQSSLPGAATGGQAAGGVPGGPLQSNLENFGANGQ